MSRRHIEVIRLSAFANASFFARNQVSSFSGHIMLMLETATKKMLILFPETPCVKAERIYNLFDQKKVIF